MKSMLLWHPDSPGISVTVLVPWWRRRSARKWGFATNTEVLRMYKHRKVEDCISGKMEDD